MALAEYRLCDVCDGKAFYDANLNYDCPDKHGNLERGERFRVAGEDQGSWGMSLDYVGDWAVICNECAKTHRVAILPRITGLGAKEGEA